MSYKYSFCTISTASHIYKCQALAESIKTFGGFLHVLIVDEERTFKTLGSDSENSACYSLSSLTSKTSQKIITKYKYDNDKLRWSLKSEFLLKLLSKEDKTIYVDNDIHFFNNFKFLFEELNDYDILLSPHHYPSNPEKEQNWFEANFRVGLFNAGFLAVNKKAINTLEWWAKSCLYRCEKNYFRGLFDDQKYLDLFPILHPNTKILRHKGCNVAAWNEQKCSISIVNNEPRVNNSFPLVFYHFNYYSLNFLSTDDYIFISYLKVLKKYKPSLKASDLKQSAAFISQLKLLVWKVLNSINARK